MPGAVAYHVMLDYSAYFNRPLVDRTGVAESQVQLRSLDTGKYYWRVAAVDKDGQEGAFSDFARFTVGRPSGAVLTNPRALTAGAYHSCAIDDDGVKCWGYDGYFTVWGVP